MNLRLALVTALMIMVWAAISTFFRPSQTPTVEQLLPPQALEETKQVRNSWSGVGDFMLLNLPDALQEASIKKLLAQLHQSVAGLQILCITTSQAKQHNFVPPITLTDCTDKQHHYSKPILFWRSTPRHQAETEASFYQAIEEALAEIPASDALEGIELFAPELLRSASWQAAISDLRLIAPLLGVIIIVVPLFALRSLTAPTFIFLTASVTTTATLLLFNLKLQGGINALLLAVIPLIWAISSMDAAHLVERIEAYRKRGVPDAFQRAARELAAPCAVTTATTFVGFGALALQGNSPLLRSFGITAAAGTLLAILFTFLLGWLLLDHHPTQQPRHYTVNPLAAMSHTLVSTSLRHPLATLSLWIIITVSLTPFAFHVTSDTPFPNIFSHDHPLSEQTEKLQRLLASDLRPLTIYLTADSESGNDSERLIHALTATMDYVSKLPESRLVLPAAIMQATCEQGCSKGNMTSERWTELLENSGVARMDVFFSPHKPARNREIIDWLKHFDHTMLGNHRLHFDGPGYLYPAVETLGVSGAIYGVFLSITGILLLLWAVFRQAGIVIPALLVTLLPLWLVVGCMGVADIDWSLALLGVPAMLFGLAVDDTIHLLWHHGSRRNLIRTLRHNALISGTALSATTLMLCLSVATLNLSSLQANQELALLLSVGMGLALLMDLTLLPAIISLSKRK